MVLRLDKLPCGLELSSTQLQKDCCMYLLHEYLTLHNVSKIEPEV